MSMVDRIKQKMNFKYGLNRMRHKKVALYLMSLGHLLALKGRKITALCIELIKN